MNVTKGLGAMPPATSAIYGDDQAQDDSGAVLNGDDALLDLDQLEELHDEAERMKALGNKHMAAQVRIEMGCRKITGLVKIRTILTNIFI